MGSDSKWSECVSHEARRYAEAMAGLLAAQHRTAEAQEDERRAEMIVDEARSALLNASLRHRGEVSDGA